MYSSLALAFLFITQLGLFIALLLTWWRLKDRMQALEAKTDEALDDHDLMEFQDRIVGLLGQVKEAGKDVVALIDERRAALEGEGARAREAEKRLAEKIKAFERVEEKARKSLADWAQGQKRAAVKGKGSSKKAPKSPAPAPEAAAEAAPEATTQAGEALTPTAPLKVTYLKRDFRAPEPQAPVTPTATRYLKVYEMADQGSSASEIAKACGYLPGEVELILNLRPRPRS